MTVIMRISHATERATNRRSDLSAPYMIRDGLDYVASPIDGTPYTSKREYYRHIKASGCEIAGNDSSLSAMKRKPITAPPGRKEAIRKAWDANT